MAQIAASIEYETASTPAGLPDDMQALPGASLRFLSIKAIDGFRPVEPGAGQEAHRAAIQSGVHAEAVELDFVQPLVAFRRRVDELGQLRPNPLRQSGVGPPG
jgi:hypothetical protein